MPLPLPLELSAQSILDTASLGLPGSIYSPAPGVGFNVLHVLLEGWAAILSPALQAHMLQGLFVASIGGPGSINPPLPLPLISTPHMAASVAPLSGLIPGIAAQIISTLGWVGSHGLLLPTAVAQTLLTCLSRCSFSIAPVPADPVFASLGPGLMTYQPITPFVSAPLVSSLVAHWSSDPRLGPWNRAPLAYALLEPCAVLLGALNLSCSVTGVPPGFPPLVPGTPYPHTLPLLVT